MSRITRVTWRIRGASVLSLLLALVTTVGSGGAALADGDWLSRSFPTHGNWGDPGRSSGVGRISGVSRTSGSSSYGGRTARGSRRGVQVASLGNYAPSFGPSLSRGAGAGVRWVASPGCLNPTLRSAIATIASYGHVTVSSTCRSHAHNRRVGGAPRSHHLGGNAADFRIRGNVGAALAALRSMGGIGGIKHYGGGLIHIDTGPRRTF